MPARGTADHALVVQDRLASWVCDLSLLHELTERLARTTDLGDTLREVLRAGATLVGARRGLIALAPADGLGPGTTVGLGLGHGELGTLETIPHDGNSPCPAAGSTPMAPAPPMSPPLSPPAPTPPAAPAASTPPIAPASAPAPRAADTAGSTGDTDTGGPASAGGGTAASGGTGAGGGTGAVGTSGGTGAGAPQGIGTVPDAGSAPTPAPSSSPAPFPEGTRAQGDGGETVHPDLAREPGVTPRHREVAAQLGIGASYALRLAAERTGRLGTGVWFYDEAAAPTDRQRRLIGLYLRFAAEHLARCLELDRAAATTAALAAELLPARLPRVPGVRMAVRHATGPRGGGDWYDAMPLPEGALGLAVGGVTGAGPGAVAAMGRLRASLRAYAVIEGEDPVAVLSDLELLLRLTEPARSATALFAYAAATPGGGRAFTLAGAGHCPPLVVGERRCEFVETSLSAPLNMLSCWEAPSAELRAAPGESLLLYTDGLLHRTGEPADHAFARLHSAAQGAPRAAREDPERLADHILHTLLPDGLDAADGVEDLVLLIARFD